MLYKFKSKASGDLIMLEPNGRRMLEIIGKTPGPQGIIEVHQMAAAVAALEGLGLVPDVQEGLVTPLNRVYNQTPDAGTLVPEGSTVTISII